MIRDCSGSIDTTRVAVCCSLNAMNQDIFSLAGRVAVVTGGYGVLGGTLASGLAEAGARVAVIGRKRDAAERKVAEIHQAGYEAMAVVADVVDEAQLKAALADILGAWGQIDILVNAAGGNVSRARSDTKPVFDIPMDAFDEVLRLNLHGTVVPSMIFGAAMAERRSGCIINISSMAAQRALTHLMGYSIAKAGVENMTRWLAVDLARRYGAGIRVNAIAPGFFVANQNRALLIKPDGTHTPRGSQIINATPMGRFGEAHELVGPVRFLCSDAASFVTGVVLNIDGGFSAFCGV
jgi:NAD(P)-dependent dehydrogenase (short-subunit alcohol dehydrogenase family)